MMLLRVRSLALGHSGVRPAGRAGAGRPAQRRHHAVGAGARLARRLRRPGAAGALRAGAARRGLGARQGRRPDRPRPRRCTRPGCSRSTLAAKEGLALINGTDGMLGMLLLAIDDARAPVHHGRRDRGAGHRGDARLGPAVPAGAARDPAASRARPCRRRTSTGCCRARPSWTRTATTWRTPCRTRTRCAARRRWPARPGTPSTSPPRWPGGSCVSVVDNPVVLPDGRVESTGNFHGAPLGFAADFLAIAAAEVGAIAERRVDRLLDVTRSRELPRVPLPRRRGQLRADDRAVHGGRHRRGEPPAGRARLGGLAADQRHAGGPRLDGLGGGQEAAHACWTT